MGERRHDRNVGKHKIVYLLRIYLACLTTVINCDLSSSINNNIMSTIVHIGWNNPSPPSFDDLQQTRLGVLACTTTIKKKTNAKVKGTYKRWVQRTWKHTYTYTQTDDTVHRKIKKKRWFWWIVVISKHRWGLNFFCI